MVKTRKDSPPQSSSTVRLDYGCSCGVSLSVELSESGPGASGIDLETRADTRLGYLVRDHGKECKR